MLSLPISVYPIESKPYGLTYGEWSVKWWQWLLSIPTSTNPSFDNTGLNASINQVDPNVFFLCETIEGVDTIPVRKISLHQRKSIFMPIINWISTSYKNKESDEELLTAAKKRMDAVANLQITINGVTIEGLKEYRALSPFFEAILPQDNIFNLDEGKHRCISDGFYLFFKPLEKFASISSFGSCSSGATKIGINYNLVIR